MTDGKDIPVDHSRRATPKASEVVLLQDILALSVGKKTSNALAMMLLLKFGSVRKVISASKKDLTEAAVLTPRAVSTLKLFHESYMESLRARLRESSLDDNQAALFDYAVGLASGKKVQCIHCIFFDAGRRFIYDEQHSEGSINHAPIYPRELFKRAFELNAFSIIILTIIPSGYLLVEEDGSWNLEDLRQAAEVLGFEVYAYLKVDRDICSRWSY